MFRDRTDAGERLADLLVERGVAADLVLAVPRGGLPVARPVADALGAPLDVAVAKKIGAPGNPEYALGAVASDGSVYVDDAAAARAGADAAYLDTARERVAATARETEAAYREGPPPDLRDAAVVLVDDGVATGATLLAAVRMLRGRGAARVTVAVPVGSRSALDALSEEADEVVALSEPANFSAVGQFYEDFAQVSDEEAIAVLRG